MRTPRAGLVRSQLINASGKEGRVVNLRLLILFRSGLSACVGGLTF